MNILQLSTAYIRARALNSVLNIILLSLGIGTIVLLLLFSDQMQKRLMSDAEGLDLVVGAKGSPMQLILSSIYHIDIPTGNIPYPRLEWLRSNRLVKEVIPVALGDSYKGFRIVGTEHNYPQHYGIELAQGELWKNSFDVVIGARVAEELHLHLGDSFFGSHGMVDGGHVHENRAYTIAGILEKNNSVMDRLILTSVPTVWISHNLIDDHTGHEGHHANDGHTEAEHNAMGVSHHEDDGHTAEEHRAIGVAHSKKDPHHDHDHGSHGHHEDDGHTAEQHQAMGVAHKEDHSHHEEHGHEAHGHHEDEHGDRDGYDFAADQRTEKEWLASIDTSKQEITALLVKFKSPLGAVQLPMQVNRQSEMQAARPAQETSRLFALLGGVIETLYGFGFLLVITSGLGVFIALYNAMKDRRYDLAIMRSLGASRSKLLAGVVLEGLLLVLMGTALGFLIGHGVAHAMGELMPKAKEMGLTGAVWVNKEWAVLGLSFGVALLASIIPAIQAYRTDIAETLSKSK